MARKNNILIVSASIGEGHNQAARAIQEELLRREPAARVTVIDFMSWENSSVNTLIKDAYLKMLNLSPEVYDFLYRWCQHPTRGRTVQDLMSIAWRRSMARLLERNRPDFLVCTHPFPFGAAAALKRSGRLTVPMAGVITDYTVHKLWAYQEADLYFVAGPELRRRLTVLGVPPEIVYPLGIPIKREFSDIPDRNKAREELGLSTRQPVVLIMGGGLGLGPVKGAIAGLNKVSEILQLVVVAGKNPMLKANLEAVGRISRHSVRIMGFTNQIPKLMAAADVLVTKPGALTISEALAVKLPMVFYQPIPGQEEDNAEYVCARGAGIWVKDSMDFGQEISKLLNDPLQLAKMQQAASVTGRPGAAGAVASAIMEKLAEGLNSASEYQERKAV